MNILNKINKFHLTIVLFLIAIIFSTLLIYTNLSFAKTNPPVYVDHHRACSNNNWRECVANCRESNVREREPKQRPPVPTTPTPEPPFEQTQTTTTTQPIFNEVRCSSTNDCNIGFVCCQNVCRKESEGICRDINGDGIPDWLVYIV